MNNRIVWTTRYNIGIPKLDEQHLRLVGILVRLQESVSEGGGSCDMTCVQMILDELSDYASSHFRDEEKLMRSVDYPSFEEHVRAHRFFTDAVVEWKEKVNEKTPSELAVFLNEWLLEHILREDIDIKNYL
ncbi:MAG: bacteriohemerythrin [Spirochaetota bacterium]